MKLRVEKTQSNVHSTSHACLDEETKPGDFTHYNRNPGDFSERGTAFINKLNSYYEDEETETKFVVLSKFHVL